MSRRKQPSGDHPVGRPVTVGADAQVLVRLPAALSQAAREAARRLGITASEWWRRAAKSALSRGD